MMSANETIEFILFSNAVRRVTFVKTANLSTLCGLTNVEITRSRYKIYFVEINLTKRPSQKQDGLRDKDP